MSALDICVLKQFKQVLMETDFLLPDMMLFSVYQMLPVFDVLVQHFGLYCDKHLCALLLVQCVYYQKLMVLIFPVVFSITTFVTVPIAPFVNPSVMSILVVIITLTLIFMS